MHPILKTAQEILEARDATLQCDAFIYVIEVTHHDGSHFLFQNADMQVRKIKGAAVLLIWTEHCGFYAFFLEDIGHWRKYKDANDYTYGD